MPATAADIDTAGDGRTVIGRIAAIAVVGIGIGDATTKAKRHSRDERKSHPS
jgi:hypothetical protein